MVRALSMLWQAKPDLFKDLFREELAKGRDGRSAVEQSKTRLSMDIDDQ